MARNIEFDDALDELKMLHDAKNHDYATEENPYKNLEGVERIGIEAWRGIVIRLMDKFERVEQYCTNGELAIKSEGIEDTFKDIAIYSILAMILFRKEQEKQQELTELERGKGKEFDLPKIDPPEWDVPEHPSLFPVDDKYNGDESYTHPMIAMRESAEKQQEEEDTENLRQALQSKIDKEEQRRGDENLAHIKSLMERDKLSDVEKLEVQRRVNKHNNYREDEAKKNESWLRSQSPKDGENN